MVNQNDGKINFAKSRLKLFPRLQSDHLSMRALMLFFWFSEQFIFSFKFAKEIFFLEITRELYNSHLLSIRGNIFFDPYAWSSMVFASKNHFLINWFNKIFSELLPMSYLQGFGEPHKISNIFIPIATSINLDHRTLTEPTES